MDIEYRLENLEFEWNLEKAERNIDKHGVTFKEAAEVFLDPFYVMGDASLMTKIESLFWDIHSPSACYWSFI